MIILPDLRCKHGTVCSHAQRLLPVSKCRPPVAAHVRFVALPEASRSRASEPVTPAEHYNEAERLLELAAAQGDVATSKIALVVQYAHVHATLALATPPDADPAAAAQEAAPPRKPWGVKL